MTKYILGPWKAVPNSSYGIDTKGEGKPPVKRHGWIITNDKRIDAANLVSIVPCVSMTQCEIDAVSSLVVVAPQMRKALIALWNECAPVYGECASVEEYDHIEKLVSLLEILDL